MVAQLSRPVERKAVLVLQSESRQIFPRYRRITSSEEFGIALNSLHYSNKWFSVYVTRNKAQKSRLGIIVSKRILPHAVNRNSVKRLIRERFRREFPVNCSFNLVVRLRRPLNEQVVVEGQKALIQLLNEVQLKCVNF